MSRSAAFTLAILLAVFKTGSCLRCYQCNSQSDPACSDPFAGSKYLIDCVTQDSLNYNRNYLRDILPRESLDGIVGAPRLCHKIVLESGTTIRTCLDGNPSNPMQTCNYLNAAAKSLPTNPSKQIKHCSVCDKDGCNGAGSIVASLPLAALALVASYLFYKQ